MQRLRGASLVRSRPLREIPGRPQVFACGPDQPRNGGLRALGSTGFRHGGLGAAPLSVRNSWADSGRPQTLNSAVFHNASRNAHIEWRFP